MRIVSTLVALFVVATGSGLVLAAEADGQDPFPVGSLWIGKLQPAEKGVRRERTALRIAERNGNAFTGQLFIREPRGKELTVEVEGQATSKAGGELRFKSKKDGLTRYRFQGTLENGEVKMSFVDVDAFGDKPVGDITLSRQPDLRTILR